MPWSPLPLPRFQPYPPFAMMHGRTELRGERRTPTQSCPCAPESHHRVPSRRPHPSIGPDAADETCPRAARRPQPAPLQRQQINSLKKFDSRLTPSVQGELAFKLRCFGEVNHTRAGATVPAGTHGAPRSWRHVPTGTVLSTIPSTRPRTEPQNPPWGWEQPGPPSRTRDPPSCALCSLPPTGLGLCGGEVTCAVLLKWGEKGSADAGEMPWAPSRRLFDPGTGILIAALHRHSCGRPSVAPLGFFFPRHAQFGGSKAWEGTVRAMGLGKGWWLSPGTMDGSRSCKPHQRLCHRARGAMRGPQPWHDDGDSQQTTSGHGTLRPRTAVTAGQKDAGGGSSAAPWEPAEAGKGVPSW